MRFVLLVLAGRVENIDHTFVRRSPVVTWETWKSFEGELVDGKQLLVGTLHETYLPDCK